MNKKIFIYAGIILFFVAGISATKPPEKPAWKNLKIIPLNTDEEQMERIMYKYTKQLGVTCLFCHPGTKAGVFPPAVDFATDELAAKVTSRNMMRMTDMLNKKYFRYKNDYGFNSLHLAVVTCTTCHRGIPKPSNFKLFNTQ